MVNVIKCLIVYSVVHLMNPSVQFLLNRIFLNHISFQTARVRPYCISAILRDVTLTEVHSRPRFAWLLEKLSEN